MTQKEKILALQAESMGEVSLKEIAEGCASMVSGDFDWSYDYNGTDVEVSECVGEYQVLHGCCVDMQEMAYFESKGEKIAMCADEYFDMINDMEEDDVRAIEDTLEMETDISMRGEWYQTWINCNNGSVFQLEKQNKFGELDADGDHWVFLDHVKHSSLYHEDMEIHPHLAANGYEEIHGGDWDYQKSNFLMHANYDYGMFMACHLQPHVASMIKARDYDKVLRYVKNYENYRSAFIIASRHKYMITDKDMFIDNIDMLNELGKDIHNPKFILPEDLAQEHARLTQLVVDLRERNKIKADERRRKELYEKAMKEMERMQEILDTKSKESADYIKNMSNYFDICIEGGNLICTPLKSVQEFYEEGTMMQHCVFRMGYYKKFTSLLLSCKDKNGNRVATIEYDLMRNEIIQCYGFDDKVMPQDAEIRKLIMSNVETIKEHKQRKAA